MNPNAGNTLLAIASAVLRDQTALEQLLKRVALFNADLIEPPATGNP